MTLAGNPRLVRWRELYQAAMLEPDWNKLPALIDGAINAVLDNIEDAPLESDFELDELNGALNRLRSRRKEITAWKTNGVRAGQPRAA